MVEFFIESLAERVNLQPPDQQIALIVISSDQVQPRSALFPDY